MEASGPQAAGPPGTPARERGRRTRGPGILQLRGCGWGAGSGSHLQDNVGDAGGAGRGGEERRRQAPEPSPSQSGLEGRVQDVVLMAVAVGVAVVALGAGVVGGLLQPHQHVHLGEERGSMSDLWPNHPPPWPPGRSRHLRHTHPGRQRARARTLRQAARVQNLSSNT